MKHIAKIDQEEKRFVLHEGSGYSCFGFDNCRDWTRMYAAAIGATLPEPMPYGTEQAYSLYLTMQRRYMEHPASKGTTFDPGTPDAVKTVLENARVSGRRVRLFLGDSETGRDWNEEHDVTGTIGRSMGPIKSPILLANSRSHGGGAILTACIVKIMDAHTKQILWQHPKYHSGSFTMRPVGPEECPEYPELKFAVDRDGETQARFKTEKQAQRYIDRMTGKAA